MIKRICDRCNKEIKGNYWTINIYEKEDTTMRLTTEGAVNNMQPPIYIIVQIFKKLIEFIFDIAEPIAEAQYKLIENMMSFWKKVFKKRVKL